jgi:hypothetical protein
LIRRAASRRSFARVEAGVARRRASRTLSTPPARGALQLVLAFPVRADRRAVG